MDLLLIGPNRTGSSVWTTWVVVEGGGVQLTASVHSLKEAVERALQSGQDLRVEPEAYEEMVVAGLAPAEVPEDYRDVL